MKSVKEISTAERRKRLAIQRRRALNLSRHDNKTHRYLLSQPYSLAIPCRRRASRGSACAVRSPRPRVIRKTYRVYLAGYTFPHSWRSQLSVRLTCYGTELMALLVDQRTLLVFIGLLEYFCLHIDC